MTDATAQEGPKLSFKGERQLRYYWFIALTMMIVAPLAGVYPIFLMKILCFAIFACAFNLLVGFTGLVSFGHAAFFGVSAYVTGWLAVNGFTPEIAIAGGVLTAAAMAFVVAILSIRRQGIYFAMITLALSQLVFFMCLQAPFTGGEDGLQRIPRGNLFGLISLKSDLAMYFFILFAFAGVFVLLVRIVHSPFGQLLKAVRENEQRATSFGYVSSHYKLIAFVLSGALSGLAGSLKCIALGFATLTDVHWMMSGEVILMTFLGGVGTFVGPALGAFVVIGLQNTLSDKVGSWVTVILGLCFVACVSLLRRGMVGEWNAWTRPSVKRRASQE
ncbi:branched-chain amino acid ABC transporter permease [Allorhizobium pseudoryzae]|uniref:branched-chain amino acid ABC transporter permease n=1 Tax=Allorhizobium pseudoryzae TaxID=379684 RepID=UPI003D082CD9